MEIPLERKKKSIIVVKEMCFEDRKKGLKFDWLMRGLKKTISNQISALFWMMFR